MKGQLLVRSNVIDTRKRGMHDGLEQKPKQHEMPVQDKSIQGIIMIIINRLLYHMWRDGFYGFVQSVRRQRGNSSTATGT